MPFFATQLAGVQGSVCPGMWGRRFGAGGRTVAEPPAQEVAKPAAATDEDARVGEPKEEAVQVCRKKASSPAGAQQEKALQRGLPGLAVWAIFIKSTLMGWYQRVILPRVIHAACSSSPAARQRAKVVPRARGRVLEIGLGSGLNLPYYDPSEVRRVWGLEPSEALRKMARQASVPDEIALELLAAEAEAIPLEKNEADTVLITYTLCTIADVPRALEEARRVLKPGGQLLFCEHGRAPDAAVRRWQDWVNPLWKRAGGGCHLNRDIPALLRAGGFAIQDLHSMYIPGWKPASFNYWGAAYPK